MFKRFESALDAYVSEYYFLGNTYDDTISNPRTRPAMIKTQLNVDGTLELQSVFHGKDFGGTFTTSAYIAMDMLNLDSKNYCAMLRGSNGDLTSSAAVDIWEPG